MATTTGTRRGGPNWIAIVQGAVGMVFGLLLLMRPGMTLSVLLTFVGIYWIVSGILSLVNLMLGKMAGHWSVYLLHGVFAVLAGLVLIAYPQATAIMAPTMLIILVGILGIGAGVFAIVQAMRGAGWGMAGIGAISVVIGLLLLGSPLLVAYILVWIIGLGAFVGGGYAIFDGFRGSRI